MNELPGIIPTEPRYELRPYQREASDAAVAFLKGPKKHNAIEVLPTGAGKSLVLAATARELGEPVLIFQPTREILEQNYNKYLSYGETAAIYSASMESKEVGPVTFATIGSVKTKHELFSKFKYVIIDECHFTSAKGGMYKTFLDNLQGAKVLGLTATPYRLASNNLGSQLRFLTRTRPRIYREMIYYVQVSDLLRDGYLAPVKYTGVNGFDRSKLKLNSTGADFTDDSVKNYYKRSGFADTLLKMVNYQADRRRNVLVFTRFIEEARHLVERIPGSAIVTGETPAKERAKVTESFRSGQIKVAVNVAVLGIGFDFPALETVVQARPTLSLAVHYQQIGRCIRPHPQKDHALVVDLVGNVGMFGRVEDLKLVDQGGGKWVVESKGRVLTNVYFGEQRGDDPSRHGNGAGEI